MSKCSILPYVISVAVVFVVRLGSSSFCRRCFLPTPILLLISVSHAPKCLEHYRSVWKINSSSLSQLESQQHRDFNQWEKAITNTRGITVRVTMQYFEWTYRTNLAGVIRPCWTTFTDGQLLTVLAPNGCFLFAVIFKIFSRPFSHV